MNPTAPGAPRTPPSSSGDTTAVSEPPNDGDLAAYYRHSRPEIRRFIEGAQLRVLELGCGAGQLGRALLADGVADSVHGIELDPAAAERASEDLTLVVRGDVGTLRDLGLSPPYDLVIAADVLEHLVDPWETLRELHAFTAPEGRIIASLPNIRCATVLVPLVVRGRFDYADEGILDRTHLRFFTRHSMAQMFESTGWSVEQITRIAAPDRRPAKSMAARLLGDFGASQLLVTARPARSPR